MSKKQSAYPGTESKEMTSREVKHGRLSREAAREGFVLLKNENQTLPIVKGSRIGLYGAGACKTIKGGTGSGDVNSRYNISIREGLEEAGYQLTSKKWLDSYETIYTKAREAWRSAIFQSLPQYQNNLFRAYTSTPFRFPCGDGIDVEEAKHDGADVALFVISRIAGEGADRRDVPGDYYLSEEEYALLTQVSGAYRSVVLIINSGGPVDLSFLDEFLNISAILYFVQAGQEGGRAFADILCGEVSPSGKLTDTWANTYTDYPNADTFSYKSGDVYREDYVEGIFVGYRYFDTYDIPVRYCFGYGLSYTTFATKNKKISVLRKKSEPEICVDVEIVNIGTSFSGKEIIQLYVSAPQGRLCKPYRVLAAFGKTDLLRPGEKQMLTLSFPVSRVASYSESDSAWLLEEGTYALWLGGSLDGVDLIGSFSLNDTVTLTSCKSVCDGKLPFEERKPDENMLCIKESRWLESVRKYPSIRLDTRDFQTEMMDYDSAHISEEVSRIVDMLSVNQMISLTTGAISDERSELGSAGMMVPGSAAETSSVAVSSPWNIPPVVLADGPAGLRLKKEYQVCDDQIVAGDIMEAVENGFFCETKKEHEGTWRYQYCTSIPVGTLLAQTWNPALMRKIGRMVAQEMKLFGVALWLAPGMNIHRNPLCGRNFEYYSEDPLLTGIMATAITNGVQSLPGCGVTIKHLACNNQEDNRMGSNSVVSERALREIYLRGFEIAVKEARPAAIMTSFNLINGVHAANHYDLCTKIVRDEWGFTGVIMTDWTTTTDSTAGNCSAAGCLLAGNDLIMPGDPADHENIRSELANGNLTVEKLKKCVANIVHNILQLQNM